MSEPGNNIYVSHVPDNYVITTSGTSFFGSKVSPPPQVRLRVQKADNGFIVYVDDEGSSGDKTFVYATLEELRDRFIAEVVAGTRLSK